MKPIVKTATESTPAVKLDNIKHILEFEGVSFPENALKFYEPIMNWMSEYVDLLKKEQPQLVVCNIKITYLNSASYVAIRDIVEMVAKITNNSGIPLELNWYYEEEDYDMYELAREFETMLDLDINYFYLTK